MPLAPPSRPAFTLVPPGPPGAIPRGCPRGGRTRTASGASDGFGAWHSETRRRRLPGSEGATRRRRPRRSCSSPSLSLSRRRLSTAGLLVSPHQASAVINAPPGRGSIAAPIVADTTTSATTTYTTSLQSPLSSAAVALPAFLFLFPSLSVHLAAFRAKLSRLLQVSPSSSLELPPSFFLLFFVLLQESDQIGALFAKLM